MVDLTRVHDVYLDKIHFWAKRDDEACFTSADYPAGSKVRQYAAMIAANPGKPMIVGCSAHSAMQIYVAAAAKLTGAKGIVYTAKRAQRTDATAYAKRLGIELREERPAYLNVIQSRAALRAKKLKAGYVRWDEPGAVRDAMEQVTGCPALTRRIIIPTGSGLTAAGVLAGLFLHGRDDIRVVCVAVSPMAETNHIRALALACLKSHFDGSRLQFKLPKMSIVRAESKYDQWEAAVLPDGTALDPYYAAKALKYVRNGDLFWIPGVRPLSAMPLKCQAAIANLRAKLPSYQGAML